MNWKDFWNQQAIENRPMKGVGRIVQGKEMSELSLHKIAELVAEQLHLQAHDSLLDICCGNGELTSLLKNYSGPITAIDFSETFIEQAKTKFGNEINWQCADALNFHLNEQFDCILLYFSFQYFESNKKALALLKNLEKHLKPNGRILIGDIPDAAKKGIYYVGIGAKLKQVYHQLLGKNNMGKFWKKKQLIDLCKKAGFNALALDQQAWQPYAHYRFDVFIQKSKHA